MFTRQHYKAIAKILNNQTCVQLLDNDPQHYLLKRDVVRALANLFANDNPRFNYDKFFRACYNLDGKR